MWWKSQTGGQRGDVLASHGHSLPAGNWLRLPFIVTLSRDVVARHGHGSPLVTGSGCHSLSQHRHESLAMPPEKENGRTPEKLERISGCLRLRAGRLGEVEYGEYVLLSIAKIGG